MAKVRFVSPKHPNLRIRFDVSEKKKFTVKFQAGDAYVTDEQAAIMREDSRCNDLFLEMKATKKSEAAASKKAPKTPKAPKAPEAPKVPPNKPS